MGVSIVLMSKFFPFFFPLPQLSSFRSPRWTQMLIVRRYIPPRQNWPSGGPRASSPLITALHPAPRTHLSAQSSDSYYEDVDPRFSPPPQTVGLASTTNNGAMVPAPLMPGGGRMGSPVGGVGGGPGAGRMGSPDGSERGEGRWGGGGQGQQRQGGRNVLDSNSDFALPGGRM
jgi:hypothetical protein